MVDFQGGFQEGGHAGGAGRVADLADDGTHQQRLPAAVRAVGRGDGPDRLGILARGSRAVDLEGHDVGGG